MPNQYTTSQQHTLAMAKKCCRHLLVLRTIEQSKTTESQHDPLSNHRIDNSHKLCHYVSSSRAMHYSSVVFRESVRKNAIGKK